MIPHLTFGQFTVRLSTYILYILYVQTVHEYKEARGFKYIIVQASNLLWLSMDTRRIFFFFLFLQF